MDGLKILNSREKKPLVGFIDSQWGCEFPITGAVFLMHDNDRLYIADQGIGLIDLNELRVDHIGLYLGTVEDSGLRLSIEGSQIVGPLAKKNILDISIEQRDSWLRGEELTFDSEKNVFDSKYVLLRSGDDFIGSGKASKGKVINFVPKGRRLSSDRSS
jgi:NOL1/NOP2/fmu family ribosome biogenesis protein